MEHLNIDTLLKKNEDFWKSLEIHCLVECCGIDAFAFDKKNIQKESINHDVSDIQNNLKLIIKQIDITESKKISSDLFNLYENKKVFKNRINEILKVL
ncbi:DUF6331 family protein [Olleya sp. Bg11-27]|uniref:DUF6331 family protein n=1 Tax=Olleya sp. Bg11-27 TaxID=2058135 RepID=UPI000C30F289|nr:DUF6331 family protein [Olleya sp. Bg11-27]AUC74617.1 hypothetical protein CW732_02545 [Olleya sp. Bg11-27]